MTALALRHVPRGEVIQLLTWHVASTRDLPGVLAWRLGQVLTAARRNQVRQSPPTRTASGPGGPYQRTLGAERILGGMNTERTLRRWRNYGRPLSVQAGQPARSREDEMRVRHPRGAGRSGDIIEDEHSVRPATAQVQVALPCTFWEPSECVTKRSCSVKVPVISPVSTPAGKNSVTNVLPSAVRKSDGTGAAM